MSKKTQKKQDRNEAARQSAKDKKMAEWNAYLNSGQPFAKTLYDYFYENMGAPVGKTRDVMHNIRVKIAQLLHLNNVIINCNHQIKTKIITDKDENTGVLMTMDQIKEKIIVMRGQQYRVIGDIEGELLNLGGHIGVTITEEDYERFGSKVEDKIKELGHELFKSSIEDLYNLEM